MGRVFARQAKLSTGARKILQSRETPLAFSLVTLCEVAIQTSLARPGFSVDPQRLQPALLAEGMVEVPITAAQIVRVATLPWVHRDPFDRLLVAQAIEDRLTLLTSDATLKRYGSFVKLV